MKRETKELIDWIKKQIILAGNIVTDISHLLCWQLDRDEAIKFLDSLPEIEEKLCFGGYIQDKNGTPCCHGDKIRVDDTCGELYWSQRDYCFYYKTRDTLYKLYSRFEKVEK